MTAQIFNSFIMFMYKQYHVLCASKKSLNLFLVIVISNIQQSAPELKPCWQASLGEIKSALLKL